MGRVDVRKNDTMRPRRAVRSSRDSREEYEFHDQRDHSVNDDDDDDQRAREFRVRDLQRAASTGVESQRSEARAQSSSNAGCMGWRDETHRRQDWVHVSNAVKMQSGNGIR